MAEKVIAVTGTPGAGKTFLSNYLAEKLGYMHIELTTFIKQAKLYDSYDKISQCYTVDAAKLVDKLTSLISNTKKSIIVDGHLSHFLPNKMVDLCIVVKCGLKKIEKRLKKRKYSKEKIRENIDSEIFDICLNEAKENEHNILCVNESEGLSKVLKKVKKRLSS